MTKRHYIALIEHIHDNVVQVRVKERTNDHADEFFADIEMNNLTLHLDKKDILVGAAIDWFVEENGKMTMTIIPVPVLTQAQLASIEQEAQSMATFFAQFSK